MQSLLKSKTSIFLSVFVLFFSLAGCDSNDNDEPEVAADIVQVATDAGFSTLVSAIQAADLVSTLQGPGPFTVFAPTNDAFAALPAGTLDDLLLPENKATLEAILTYHVVQGRVTADQVVNLTTASTVQGQDLTIAVNGGTVSINDISIVQTDIEASNGIIHIIDGVLLPPSQ